MSRLQILDLLVLKSRILYKMNKDKHLIQIFQDSKIIFQTPPLARLILHMQFQFLGVRGSIRPNILVGRHGYFLEVHIITKFKIIPEKYGKTLNNLCVKEFHWISPAKVYYGHIECAKRMPD